MRLSGIDVDTQHTTTYLERAFRLDLLVEIGCEEIPARFIPGALDALEKGFAERARKHRLDNDGQITIETMGTPRRLAMIVHSMIQRQPDTREEILGPQIKAAYDSNGKPTKAALGFAKSHGVAQNDLIQVDTAKGKVLAVCRDIKGLQTIEVLPDMLRDLLDGLRFPKAMKWAEGIYSFARPIHWLLALLDQQVVPFTFAGVQSSNTTRGHRFSHPQEVTIEKVDQYHETLKRLDVMVSIQERREAILQQTDQLAREARGAVIPDAELVEEVCFLVEKPVGLLGHFEKDFLELPHEVLVAAMRNHQRYFAIRSENGGLKNAFIAIGNTPVKDPDVVRHGNERVLRARLRDAQFFFEEDLKRSLVDKVLGLQEMVFQADLGSYYEKAHRIGNLAVGLAEKLQLGKWDQQYQLVDALGVRYEEIDDPQERFGWNVARASLLAKVDLLTEMVGEFPELQGCMGGIYSLRSGDPEQVSLAISEHYLPRFAKDQIPRGHEGAVVSLADRLDTLAGCFGIGLRPTGAADPFALRRQCLGVIAIILGKGYHVSLDWLLQQSIEGAKNKIEDALLRKAQIRADKRAVREKKNPVKVEKIEPFAAYLREDLKTFFAGRLRQRFVESAPADVVEAVLAAGMDDMYDAKLRVEALNVFSRRSSFGDLAVAFKRVANIIKDFKPGVLKTALFDQEEEKDLHAVLVKITPVYEKLMAQKAYLEGMELLAGELRGPVDTFFERVLVNDPNDLIRQANRKTLLSIIESLFGRIADFTKLQLHGDTVSAETT